MENHQNEVQSAKLLSPALSAHHSMVGTCESSDLENLHKFKTNTDLSLQSVLKNNERRRDSCHRAGAKPAIPSLTKENSSRTSPHNAPKIDDFGWPKLRRSC